jgi:hypothetical protein
MPRALKITRAPVKAVFREIDIKRDREPDIRFTRGRLLLTVETEPGRYDPQRSIHATRLGGERWRVYRLFENETHDRAVVASEGHSTVPGETTRYGAKICKSGADVWEAMGKYDELKPILAELNWPAVEEI